MLVVVVVAGWRPPTGSSVATHVGCAGESDDNVGMFRDAFNFGVADGFVSSSGLSCVVVSAATTVTGGCGCRDSFVLVSSGGKVAIHSCKAGSESLAGSESIGCLGEIEVSVVR